MIVSIHQPNFFPWLGYFNKVFLSDKFVYLTEAQRSKNDKYLSRARIISNNQSIKILSVPIGSAQTSIDSILLPEDKKWKQKFLNSISEAYRYSIFFDQIYNDIEMLIKFKCKNFDQLSIHINNFFFTKFNIDTLIHIDKQFDVDFGFSNQRNISICKHLGAKKYLSGTGAAAYNDLKLFDKNNLELIYQNFNLKAYPQNALNFIGGLSIIDALFNCGYASTEELIKQKNSN